MKNNSKYDELVKKSFNQGSIDPNDIKWILTNSQVDLLLLLQAAFQVRYRYFRNNVRVHILNNVQSGGCSEDCKYCAQSKKSKNIADTYPMKPDSRILNEAESAFRSGAFRHCMVFSGKSPGKNRIEKICSIVKKIKALYPMEICVSAGFISKQDAKNFIAAGVNRYNHNLNTSSGHYGSICSSHEFQQRVKTISNAKSAGLDICSGVIMGMGESIDDIVQVIEELKNIGVNSIPVNFFMPFEGHRVKKQNNLTPQLCLKILAAFRFANPKTEIRAAGGREFHLRSLQPFCLYAVNSIFADGYLTMDGDEMTATRQMIEDSGFVIEKYE